MSTKLDPISEGKLFAHPSAPRPRGAVTLPTAERCRELAEAAEPYPSFAGAITEDHRDVLTLLRWAAEVLEGMGREPEPSGELAMRISCGFDGACTIAKTQDAIDARDAAHQAEVLGLREALRGLLDRAASVAREHSYEAANAIDDLAEEMANAPTGVTAASAAPGGEMSTERRGARGTAMSRSGVTHWSPAERQQFAQIRVVNGVETFGVRYAVSGAAFCSGRPAKQYTADESKVTCKRCPPVLLQWRALTEAAEALLAARSRPKGIK